MLLLPARGLGVATVVAVACGGTPRASLADETSAALAGQEQRAETGATTIWDGVFTEAQAQRGAAVYTGPCSHCHGYRLNGAPDDPDMFPSPPVAGVKFLRDWEGRSLAALFEYTRATMPENNPSYLADQEYADVLAYMLSVSGLPAQGQELKPDLESLARIVIRRQPERDRDASQHVPAQTPP